jgi:hypothetical protein
LNSLFEMLEDTYYDAQNCLSLCFLIIAYCNEYESYH